MKSFPQYAPQAFWRRVFEEHRKELTELADHRILSSRLRNRERDELISVMYERVGEECGQLARLTAPLLLCRAKTWLLQIPVEWRHAPAREHRRLRRMMALGLHMPEHDCGAVNSRLLRQRILSALLPQQRQVIQMRLNGLSYAAIHRLTGRSVAALRASVSRSFNRLRSNKAIAEEFAQFQ